MREGALEVLTRLSRTSTEGFGRDMLGAMKLWFVSYSC